MLYISYNNILFHYCSVLLAGAAGNGAVGSAAVLTVQRSTSLVSAFPQEAAELHKGRISPTQQSVPPADLRWKIQRALNLKQRNEQQLQTTGQRTIE